MSLFDPIGFWWQFVALGILVIGLAVGLAASSDEMPSSKYNTVYKRWSKSMNNYNCYAYALGKTNVSWYPGFYSGKSYVHNVKTLKDYVLLDLKKLKYKSKEVKKSYKPNKKETMIALRIGYKDFHFMKRMKDGSWTHKPGRSTILKLKGKPWDYTAWPLESYLKDGWKLIADKYYDSKIYYIVYWKK